MPRLVACLMVIVVHLAVNLTAWTRVGLLADDHELLGAAVLRHRGDWSFASMFLPAVQDQASRALYRPFLELAIWFEQPWFGVEAFGYHAVISLLHCGAALMWGGLVRRLSGSLAAGLATALLFVGWPGHSEATHWIAAQTTVQSIFLLTAALLTLDVAIGEGRSRALRAALLTLAGSFAVLAIGSKESAVFVLPLAGVLCWLRTPRTATPGRRMVSAMIWWAPLALASAAWLWWRAHCIGTWGSGTHYGWQLQRISLPTCLDWIAVLTAPVQRSFAAAPWSALLWLAHCTLLLLAVRAWQRAPASRGVLTLGGGLLGLGYLAGIGLESMHLATLENVRYTYEPSLGLCALFGIGIATLPPRWRGVALAVLVSLHACVLHRNRQSWLRASAVYERMTTEVCDLARQSQRPVHVVDAPGVYDGAFAWLNGATEFRFLQAFAPPDTNLRGGVASMQEWRQTLRELAENAAQRRPLDDWRTVRWDDGALSPVRLDAQWPAASGSGTTILLARIARTRPFAGDSLPVHALVQTNAAVTLQVRIEHGTDVVLGPSTTIAASAEAMPVALAAPLPQLPAGESVAVELLLRDATGGDHVFRLGDTVLAAR